jgi:hypothetical protein
MTTTSRQTDSASAFLELAGGALAMSGLLRPIPTDRHAAPSPGATVSFIKEQKCASLTFAGPYQREIFGTNQLR